MITISIQGMGAVKDRLTRLTPKLQDKALRGLVQAVYTDVQNGADNHTVTGALSRSVYQRKLNNNTYEVGHDQQKAPHARYVVLGTKPHIIKPSKRKVLRWAKSGAFVFAMQVNHPGYKGDHYLRKSSNAAPSHMERIVKSIENQI